MPIHRLILRLDYEACYDLFDYPGRAVKHLVAATSAKDVKSYDNISTDKSIYRVTGQTNQDGLFRQIAIEPNNMACDLESRAGLDIKAIGRNPNYLLLSDDLKEICRLYQLNKFTRVGIRMFYCDSLFGDRDVLTKAFNSAFDSGMLDAVNSTLGGVEDSGVSFVGSNNLGVGYRIQCGPYKQGEALKFLQQPFAFNVGDEERYDFAMDIDFFQQSMQLEPYVLSKWFLQNVDSAVNILSGLQDLIQNWKPKDDNASDHER